MRTNLYLAFALILLGSFAYWYEVKQKPVQERAQENSKKLFVVDPARAIEKVAIQYADKDGKDHGAKDYSVAIECRENCRLSGVNAKWEIVSPIRFKADEANVGAFVTSLGGAAVSETIPIEGDAEGKLAGFGLGKDRREGRKVTLTYKNDGKAPRALAVYVGDDAAVEGSLYAGVQADGSALDRVRMIPSYVKSNLERGLSYWRAKRLFGFAASQVEKMRLTNASGTTELTKQGADWYLPGKRPADNETIDAFLAGLVFMNAVEYVSDDKAKDRAKFKFAAKPKYKLVMRIAAPKSVEKSGEGKDGAAMAGATETTLEIHEGKAGNAAKIFGVLSDRNFIVELDRVGTDKFGKKPLEFSYRYFLTEADRARVRRVRASFYGVGMKESAEFVSEDGRTWKLASGTAPSFDTNAVYEALTKLYGAKIAEYSILKTVPPGNPLISEWELKDKDGKLLRTVAVHGTSGNYFAKLSGGAAAGAKEAIAKLESAPAAALPTSLGAFRKPEPVKQASGSSAAQASNPKK
ncbi:MAG: DUF4340 domain-containing protein [Deltaproteobacteria bacterium]|nr:DUF4340 domain-containing protein [Deltaproteobacteria bacterium]